MKTDWGYLFANVMYTEYSWDCSGTEISLIFNVGTNKIIFKYIQYKQTEDRKVKIF